MVSRERRRGPGGVLLALAVLAGCAQGQATEPSAPPPPAGTGGSAPAPSVPDTAPPPPTFDAAGVDADDPPPEAGPPDLDPPELAPEAPAGPILARDLTITLVEGAQGVFVPIAKAGAAVPTTGRRADLIEGRALFVRVHVAPAAGFVARPLRGKLTWQRDDAPDETFTDDKMIAGPTRAADLATSFNFLLPASAVAASGRLLVEIHDQAPSAAEGAPARFPADGSFAPLGIKAGKMELDLVLVVANGPMGPLMDTPARRERVEKYLFDVYPVQKLNLRWRDGVDLPARISTADGFALLQRLRMMDGAKPNEYYHLLVGVEDATSELLGIAAMAGPGPGEAGRRIGMTFVRKRAIDSELDTISHEMGHNHGQQHVAGCNAQSTDPRYPYPNTMVGVDGYSISENALKPAAMFKDLMGYCYPTWISDYTFGAFGRRVRAVSAYPTDAMALASHSLQGFVDARGAAFGVVPGSLVPEGLRPTRTRRARLHLADGRLLDRAVAVSALGEGEVHELAVDLADAGEITRIELSVDGRHHVIGRDVLDR